jgi:hypothetical protein
VKLGSWNRGAAERKRAEMEKNGFVTQGEEERFWEEENSSAMIFLIILLVSG